MNIKINADNRETPTRILTNMLSNDKLFVILINKRIIEQMKIIKYKNFSNIISLTLQIDFIYCNKVLLLI